MDMRCKCKRIVPICALQLRYSAAARASPERVARAAAAAAAAATAATEVGADGKQTPQAPRAESSFSDFQLEHSLSLVRTRTSHISVEPIPVLCSLRSSLLTGYLNDRIARTRSQCVYVYV